MDWVEEMKMGMQMIQSACKHNDGLFCAEACVKLCPFVKYCDKYFIPGDWDLEEEKENKK